jgi:hypothetical protein
MDMTLSRITILCLLFFASHAVLAENGALTSWDPEAISKTWVPGISTNVPLDFVYDNLSTFPVGYFIYVQDDPSCPTPPSSHSWITFALTSGSMAATSQGEVPILVPLNTNGLAFGTYLTNICFVADDPSNPTSVAVRVTLKSVASDDIFMDGLE